MHSNHGMKLMKYYRKETQTNKMKGSSSVKEGYRKPERRLKWKRKFRQAVKTSNGLKTVMLVLDEGEKTNKNLIDAFNSVQTTDATTTPYIKVLDFTAPDKTLIGYLQTIFLTTSV